MIFSSQVLFFFIAFILPKLDIPKFCIWPSKYAYAYVSRGIPCAAIESQLQKFGIVLEPNLIFGNWASVQSAPFHDGLTR